MDDEDKAPVPDPSGASSTVGKNYNALLEYGFVRIPYERAVASFRNSQKDTEFESTLLKKFLTNPEKLKCDNPKDAIKKMQKLILKVIFQIFCCFFFV